MLEIQKRLAVNASSLSSTVRRLTSAEDTRPSAQSIGYLGVCLIVVILGSIVVIDLNGLVRDLKVLVRNLKQGMCAMVYG